MKKITFLKTMILLCALVAGSNVWAQAPVNSVLWSETWTGGDDNETPSNYGFEGTTVYGGATLTYAQSNNNTKLYSGTMYAGGSTPELLLSSSNATWTISNIPTGMATEMTLTFLSNKTTFALTSSTKGISISGSQKSWTITVTGEVSNFNLTLKNTGSSNARIDDVELKVKTAGSGSGVVAPTFSVAAGAVTVGTTVELTQTDSKTIRYTIDGTIPTKTTGTVYSTPIVITTPVTINAIAVDGDDVSGVSSASYTIDVVKPTFNVAAGSVVLGTLLTITATEGNTIIYTTDGSDPSYASSIGDIYDSPIAINSAMTVKAIAVDAYDNESGITSAAYTVTNPGAVDITPNYTFFGKNSQFSGTDFDEVYGTQDGVTVTYTRNGATMYASSTAMRFYNKNTLQFEAPTGKTITKIIFTQSNATTDDMTSTPAGYTSSTKTWTGDAASVTFTRTGSSYLQFTNITVVLANKVTLATTCTDGEKFYSTYSSGKAFRVPSDLTVSEISVSGSKLSLSNYTTGDVVPANTGVLIASSTSGDHTMSIATGGTSKLGSDNMLKPSGDAGIDGASMAAAAPSCKYYRLTMHGGSEIGFWWGAESGGPFAIAANKAYLAVPTAGARAEGLWISETSSIHNAQCTMRNEAGTVYNLNGQRIDNAQLKKGVFIQNGKKIIMR